MGYNFVSCLDHEDTQNTETQNVYFWYEWFVYVYGRFTYEQNHTERI